MNHIPSGDQQIELVNRCLSISFIPNLRPIKRPVPKIKTGIRYIRVIPSLDESAETSDETSDTVSDVSSDVSLELKGCLKRGGGSKSLRVRFNIPIDRPMLMSFGSTESFSELGDDII